MHKLNVGCGLNILPDFINLDIEERLGVDVVWNLNKTPLPFKNNHFDFILADNIIEHLDDTVKIMKELHRILKKNGKLIIIVPYYKHHSSWEDPTHQRCFTENTFKYFANNLIDKYSQNPIDKICMFTYGEIKYGLSSIGDMFGYNISKYMRYVSELFITNLKIKLIK